VPRYHRRLCVDDFVPAVVSGEVSCRCPDPACPWGGFLPITRLPVSAQIKVIRAHIAQHRA